MTLGARLKELRTQKHLKQEDLQKRFSLSSGRYSLYENDRRKPDYELLTEFADFYDVSLDYLVGRTDISITPNQIPLHFSLNEIEHIKKYRALDERGKDAVDETLEREYAYATKAMSEEKYTTTSTWL